MPPQLDKRPVLICYDGSEFAKAAIAEVAGQLGPTREVIVLSVCEPLEAIPFLGLRGVSVNQDAFEAISAETKEGAGAVAEEGVELARAAGLSAKSLVEVGVPIWRTIVEVAQELDAGLVVIGSHGRSGLSYVLLGSVATAVAQHCERSVLIVHAKP